MLMRFYSLSQYLLSDIIYFSISISGFKTKDRGHLHIFKKNTYILLQYIKAVFLFFVHNDVKNCCKFVLLRV